MKSPFMTKNKSFLFLSHTAIISKAFIEGNDITIIRIKRIVVLMTGNPGMHIGNYY